MAEEGLTLNLWVFAILEPFDGMGDTLQTPPGFKGEWPSEWSALRGCHLSAQQCAPPPLKSAQALARAGGFPRVYLNTPPDPQSNRVGATRRPGECAGCTFLRSWECREVLPLSG